ncbi:MAG: outer membrane beta-barrel protein [Myxococcales bacterium]
MRSSIALLAGLCALTPAAFASAPAAAGVEVGGFVDVYYALNTNRPDDGTSFLPGTGTSGKRGNDVSLNLAALELRRPAGPFGMHLLLGLGDADAVVHAGERALTPEEHNVFRGVQRASVSFAPAPIPGLLLEAGIFPSHVGFEAFTSRDNWTYTRGWMGEFSPYYQTGVRAQWTSPWLLRAQLHLLNGWQVIRDNNRGKTVGAQLALEGERFTLALNTLVGPELPDDTRHFRYFGDVVVQLRPLRWLAVVAMADLGYQERPGLAGDALWHAFAGYARVELSPEAALTLRGERFADPDAGITGAAQTLNAGTLTLDVRPASQVSVKLEARYDRSTAAVFSARGARLAREQLLLVSGVVVGF